MQEFHYGKEDGRNVARRPAAATAAASERQRAGGRAFVKRSALLLFTLPTRGGAFSL